MKNEGEREKKVVLCCGRKSGRNSVEGTYVNVYVLVRVVIGEKMLERNKIRAMG